MTRATIVMLVALSVILTGWFAISLGWPRRSENPTMAWLWSAMGWVAVAFDTLLLLALLRIPVPAWVALLVLLIQDGVFAWRLVVLYQVRRADRLREDA